MKVIARPAETGKTRELLEYAANHEGQVLTTDKRSLQVKARAYGIDVEIIDLNDLEEDDYNHDKYLYIHKLEDVVQELLGCQIAGYSIRMEDTKNEEI